MKRKILLTIIILMATIMLAASLNIAFATTTYVDYEHAGATCVIVDPGTNIWVRLVFFGQMQGNYYSGPNNADRFMIYVNTGTEINPNFVPVAGYEDNPTRSAFSASLGLGTVEHVVAPGHIQVLREGDSNTIMVHWNIPLEIPATASTPALTIPPGKLTFEGYGDKLLGHTGPVSIGATGWTVEYTYHYYLATASLFCVGWNIKWEPVGQGVPTGLLPRAVVDRVWTWTHA